MALDDNNDFTDDAVHILVFLHIIFSTRQQMPYLVDEDIRKQMHQRLSSIGDGMGCPCVLVSGSDDHVHLLIKGSPELSVDEMVDTLKADSAAWLQARDGFYADFDWQESSVAFTESPEYVGTIKGELERHEQMHKEIDFKTELVAILEEQGIEFDEEIWD